MNASCFSLDSSTPFLFIISLSFSFFSFLCVRDVAGRCDLRFGEVFHNFRDPITQRYGSFPFFFVHGLFRNCQKFAMYFALNMGLFRMGIFCVCLVWDFGVLGLLWPCWYACGFYGVGFVCVLHSCLIYICSVQSKTVQYIYMYKFKIEGLRKSLIPWSSFKCEGNNEKQSTMI